uniref:Uncharacterized protein n=1 Tax=Romanomermis culicivorax TaxID=13658 RepID=A0A915JHE4_ROMCU
MSIKSPYNLFEDYQKNPYFSQCAPKVLNAVPPGAFNGLNAQAAPFIPRQLNPSGHHQTASSTTAANQSVKDMQEQFRSFFPEASVKFQQLASTMSATVPPSLPSSVSVLTSSNLRPAAGWSGPRSVDPRHSLFSRPPPPLGPPHSAALTSQSADLSSSGAMAPPSTFHHGHARLSGISSAAVAGSALVAPFGAPPTLGQNFNTGKLLLHT